MDRRLRQATVIRDFEDLFEPLGLSALAVQVLSGLWLGSIALPGFRGLFSLQSPIAVLLSAKLLLLAATAALALHARPRLIPQLSDDNLPGLAWHIRAITTLAVAFVMVGAGLRSRGFG